MSSSESTADVDEKVSDYLTAGTRLVWIVDPDRRSVSIFTSAGQKRLGHGATTDGGDVLPQFGARVADFFEGLAPGR